MSQHIPMRMCIGCRKMHPKHELIKFVYKNDIAEIDIDSKKPGRGAYLCRDINCIRNARKKKALSRHFKAPVADEIYEVAEGILNG